MDESAIERLASPQSQYLDGHWKYQVHYQGVIGDIAVIDLEMQEVTDLPPMVVMVGGSEGNWFGGSMGVTPSGRLGQLLADMGYSIRNLNHFGQEPLGPGNEDEDTRPPYLYERPLEPFSAVMRHARQTGADNNRCLGFVGVSKGAELVLVLAAHEAELGFSDQAIFDAAVAVVPSHVVWQAPHRTLRIHSSWSLRGEPLPFVRFPWFSIHTPNALLGDKAAGGLALQNQALKRQHWVEVATIPVENIDMPVMLQGALSDHIWPSAEMAQAVLDRANLLNPEHAFELRQYEANHFVHESREAVLDAAIFLDAALREANRSGRCEADFPLINE